MKFIIVFASVIAAACAVLPNPNQADSTTTSTSSSSYKSRAIQNFFCNQILNAQIKKEFDASHTYLSLANHFAHDSQALIGFSKMFRESWKEELSHAEKLIDYVIMRGGSVCLQQVERPYNQSTWYQMSVCDIIDYAIQLEKSVTDHLMLVHSCASGESGTIADQLTCNSVPGCATTCPQEPYTKARDPQLQGFIEAEFLGEQVEGVKRLSDLLRRLERVSCDGLGLHTIDNEMLLKYTK